MLKQLDPATLLAKFEDIAKAGTKVVESEHLRPASWAASWTWP